MARAEGARWLLAASILCGCQDLPSPEYHTDHLDLATDFDAPVCEGTLRVLERAASRITATLSTEPGEDRFLVYWFEGAMPEPCSDVSGCFYPGTRLVYARGESIAHELVHATIDSPGQAFFVEEGLAELMGGVGVRYDPERLRGQLEPQLELSRRDYRHGRLSYPQAAHFAQWVQQTEGDGAISRLAAALTEPDATTAVREQLEGIFGTSLDRIERRYADDASSLYRGTMDDQVEELSLGDAGLWVSVAFDCDDPSVLGPLPGGDAGMYQVARLEIAGSRKAHLLVDGDPGTRVELLDPYARGVTPYALWWPSLEQDGRIARVDRGEQAVVNLRATTYLLVFIAEGDEPARLELQITR